MWKRVLAFALLAGYLGGIVSAQFVSLQAHSASTPRAYYVADFELEDPERIRPYSEGMPATLAAFGGRFVARGGQIAALEGAAPGGRSVIVEFPSMVQAQTWYASDAYGALRPIRQQSGVARAFIIEGLAN